jgi:putative NADH-flavin reductase
MWKRNQYKERKMKIAILGSTGFVGKTLLAKALERGYQVKTLVRDPEKLDIYKEKVEFITGNASQADKLEKTVVETEAVLSTLPPIINTNGSELSGKSFEELVAILEGNAIKRFIHIGGAVHGGGADENWTLGRRILSIFLNIIGRPVLIAKHLEWDVLRKSNLEWTLVRPPRVINGKRQGHLVADEKDLASVQVNVEDLAEFLLEQITSSKWIGKAPLVATVKS